MVLSGVKAGVFSTAKLVGTQTEISLAVLLLPVSRTSLWVRVLGMSYDRALMFHRWVAWWAIGGMWTHFALYVAKGGSCILTDNPGSSQMGFVAVIMFTVISVLSLDFFRRRYFELFRSVHWLAGVAFFFVLLHDGTIAAYAGAPVAIYVYDRIRRRQRSRVDWAVTDIKAVGNITQLTLAVPPRAAGTGGIAMLGSNEFTYAAGQYCFINIPAISRFQWHPFSLTSCPSSLRDANPTISVAIKSMGPGTWTHDLLAYAQARVGSSPLVAHVDGPFGALSSRLASYKHVVCVGAGIGATPLVSVVQELVASQACARITFVWTVRGVEDFEWAAAALGAMQTHARQSRSTLLSMHLHVTGAVTAEQDASFPLILQRGRPDLTQALKQVHGAGGSAGSGEAVVPAPDAVGDTVVMACGPAAVIADLHKLCVTLGLPFLHESFLF